MTAKFGESLSSSVSWQTRGAATAFFVFLTLTIESTFIDRRGAEFMALKDVSLAPTWETSLSVVLMLVSIFALFHWASLTKRNVAAGVWIVIGLVMVSFALRALLSGGFIAALRGS